MDVAATAPAIDSDIIMIPEDLMFNILLWLPVGSLLRFKSVCKSWLSIINSSSFISQQLQLSSSPCNVNDKDRHILILEPSQTARCSFDEETGYYVHQPCFSLIFTLLSHSHSQSHHLARHIHFSPHPLDKPFRVPDTLATFNGIIFLKDAFAADHYLWNPATQQFRILPCPLITIKDRAYDAMEITSANYGFGFDVQNYDYKIVRLISEVSFIPNTPIKNQVEVYSLNSDSWTDRTHDVVVPPNFTVSCDPKSPFRNNQIYCWLGYTYVLNDPQPVNHRSILSFDFSNDAFRLVPVPEVYLVDSTSTLTLALLREQLACVDWVVDSDPYLPRTGPKPYLLCCKIWVLEEYGVKETWTKLYTVVLNSSVFAVRSYINGKIIWDLPTGDQTQLCSCDPVTQEVHDLPYQEGGTPILADYKESLVSIVSRNGKQLG